MISRIRSALGPRTAATARRRWTIRVLAALIVVALAATGYHFVQQARFTTVTAHFTATNGLYPGDEVRVVGVKVGTVASIDNEGTTLKVRMRIPRSLRLPADVKAVVMAQSLVAARFVQLTPAWTHGPSAGSRLDIPIDRTAVPVEWDQVEQQLNRVTAALAPTPEDPTGPGARLLDSAATALDGGNADTLRTTTQQLSQTMSTLSAGSADLFGTIRNLEAFTTALSASDQQIVVFQGRLASVSQVLAGNHDELAGALTDLDTAIGDIQSFVTTHRDGISEQLKQLSDATGNIVSQRDALETILHRTPTALSNYYNTYQPAQGAITGVPGFPNFGNPINFVCGAIAATGNGTSEEGAKLCQQYLGPLLNTLKMNYPPLSVNPFQSTGAGPGQLVYSPPELQQLLLPGQPK
ncbi:Mce family protein MceD [Nocardia nova SH22a]|uniref:Mce family protein MceD n=1 Tax=Nocardia nova SH22a TaxID=1415166 RepID=W5TFT5_9NOCA|nr:MCE family protein [Nocardia nova]AHH18072.1 Mce family protein MceD [Nocardia nova SH22a]